MQTFHHPELIRSYEDITFLNRDNKYLLVDELLMRRCGGVVDLYFVYLTYTLLCADVK